MKRHINPISTLVVLGIILITAACGGKYSESDMLGTWKVNDWKVESSGKAINSQMDMTFEADGKYAIDYGSKKEAGKYWLSGEYLHTVAEGKSEMSVRIMKLSSDSLELQMNRGGQLERVLLLHQ